MYDVDYYTPVLLFLLMFILLLRALHNASFSLFYHSLGDSDSLDIDRLDLEGADEVDPTPENLAYLQLIAELQ